jgi:hypothetical protein
MKDGDGLDCMGLYKTVITEPMCSDSQSIRPVATEPIRHFPSGVSSR